MERKKLLRDLKRVNGYIIYLGENEDRNFNISGLSRDYLMPFFEYDEEEHQGFVRPIEHPNGLFVYYLRIKTILEKAIIRGGLSEDEVPVNAPDYLRDLVTRY